jgi:hypothetical protein
VRLPTMPLYENVSPGMSRTSLQEEAASFTFDRRFAVPLT